MRSPLGRAIGLGSAKEGVTHWWRQRVSALALVPLTVWFVIGVIGIAGADHATFVAWVRRFSGAVGASRPDTVALVWGAEKNCPFRDASYSPG